MLSRRDMLKMIAAAMFVPPADRSAAIRTVHHQELTIPVDVVMEGGKFIQAEIILTREHLNELSLLIESGKLRIEVKP